MPSEPAPGAAVVSASPAAPAAGEPGPLSRALENEVRELVRKHGIVVWLDREGAFTSFADRLAARARQGGFLGPVVAFRGSWIEWLFAVQGLADALDPKPLLVHLPGFTPETVIDTPALALYEVGRSHQRALATVIREVAHGRVEPEEIERFLASPDVTLERAERWLDERALIARGGLEAWLVEATPDEVLGRLLDDSRILPIATPEATVASVKGYWSRHAGVRFEPPWTEKKDEPESATAPVREPMAAARVALADAVIRWVLCVEYVHDLKRPPVDARLADLRRLAPPLVAQCRSLAVALRQQHPARYIALADELEGELAVEFERARPEDLGEIDTFRAEEACILAAALAALREGRSAQAAEWARTRTPERSFWIARDPLRRIAWSLVAPAAELGRLLAERPRPLAGAHTLDDAVERYARDGAAVDRAHRRFEQAAEALLVPELPDFGAFQAVAGVLRAAHRAWADDLARAFAAICRDRGFLPDAALRQRTLFEDVIDPLLRDGERVAVFLLDAFRYEMAEELALELRGGAVAVELKARLAELPTITPVGMNALAPVASGGKLVLPGGGFAGFRQGEFTVKSPADRVRAMGTRSLGKKTAVPLALADVCAKDIAALKRDVQRSTLIVVHGREIDEAGEAGVGLKTFEAQLRDIRAAWHHLELAGVKRFVFTADHGFLLADATTRMVRYGKPGDPCRRHVLADEPRAERDTVPVSLAALGYEGGSGYVLLREDTAVFGIGKGPRSFVHGGNSLQERVIPVLTVSRTRAAPGRPTGIYRVETRARQPERGLNALEVRLVAVPQPQGALGFVAPPSVDVALRVPGRADIRAIVKDAGPLTVQNGRIALPIGDAGEVVLFALEGPKDELARVEVFHPDEVERVEPSTPDAWFAVEGRSAAATTDTGSQVSSPPKASAKKKAPAASVVTTAAEAWIEAFEDATVARVFRHIGRHGAITEDEAIELLGSARAMRRFSLAFEEHLKKVPFPVRIEASASGKRYVREGGA